MIVTESVIIKVSNKNVKVFRNKGYICNSNDIVLQKGDGYKIYGDDTIALICEECKKVYGFNDVKYKQNYPRDL